MVQCYPGFAGQDAGVLAESTGEMLPEPTPRLVPLRARSRVALLVESFAPLAATVASTEKRVATLLLEESAVPARVLHRRTAALEAVVEGRRYRAEGALAMAAGSRGKAREDAIVFHFATGTPPVRRRETRAPAILPVTLVPVTAEIAPTRGLTLNVSAGGALVRAPAGLASGEELLMHLHLPSEELPVPAKGEVVRRTSDGLLGVRLDRMRDSDREMVLEWVARQSLRESR